MNVSSQPAPQSVARCPMEQLIDPLERRTKRLPNLRRQREVPWYKSPIIIGLGDCTALELFSDVTTQEAHAAIGRAAATWNRAGLPVQLQYIDLGHFPLSNLTFSGTQLSSSPFEGSQLSGSQLSKWQLDLLVTWLPAATDPEGLLGGGVQAHADYPPGNTLFGGPPLPIHFNASLLWGIEQPGRFDIETIALHELGHALGLIYHSGPETVMYDALGPAPLGVRHDLDHETLTRIMRLYSSAPN